MKDWQGKGCACDLVGRMESCSLSAARWDTRLSTSRHWNLIENMLDEWTSTVDSTLHCDWSSTVDKFQKPSTNSRDLKIRPDQLSTFGNFAQLTVEILEKLATNSRDSRKARD